MTTPDPDLGDGMAYTPDTADYAEMERAERAAALDDDIVQEEQRWLLYSGRYKLWWLPNRGGYTDSTARAGRYSYSEAAEEVTDACKYWNVTFGTFPPLVMMPESARENLPNL